MGSTPAGIAWALEARSQGSHGTRGRARKRVHGCAAVAAAVLLGAGAAGCGGGAASAGGQTSASGTATAAASGGGASAGGCVTGAAGSQTSVTAPEVSATLLATPGAACWAEIAPTPFYQMNTGGSLPTGLTPALASFKTAWSTQDLYVLVQVNNWPLFDTDSTNWWNNDTVEFYLGPNDRSGPWTGPPPLTGDNVLYTAYDGGVQSIGTYTGAKLLTQTTSGKGYSAEAIIPFSDITVTPKQGAVVGFAPVVDIPTTAGTTRDGYVFWAGTSLDYSDDSQWGTITLG